MNFTHYDMTLLVGFIVGMVTTLVWTSRRCKVYKELAEESYLSGYQKGTNKHHGHYKLIIAGNYGQFQNWVQGHIIHAFALQHLVGRDWNEVEIIKVGDWRTSPVIDLLKNYMSSTEWEEFLNDPVY